MILYLMEIFIKNLVLNIIQEQLDILIIIFPKKNQKKEFIEPIFKKVDLIKYSIFQKRKLIKNMKLVKDLD